MELDWIDTPELKKDFISYLFKLEQSDGDYKLWSQYLKYQLLEQRLSKLSNLMLKNGLVTPTRCRRCFSILKWNATNNDQTFEENYWFCTVCRDAKAILKCNATETCNILINLINQVHPQLVASIVNLMLISGNMIDYLSPPIVPNDPFRMIQSLYEESPSGLKLGGKGSVIVADIYECSSSDEHFILCLADTVSIPTRYYLHALNYSPVKFHGNQLTDQLVLLKDLIDIANQIIQVKSYLVLGNKLQKYLSPNVYKNYKHNLSMIIRLDELKLFDNNDSNSIFVEDNFCEIIQSAFDICDVVCSVVKKLKNQFSVDEYYNKLQMCLTAAIWLRIFAKTPFETLLLYIINSK